MCNSGLLRRQILQTDTTVNMNPNDTITIGLRHIMQQISMPAGNVAIHVGSLDMSVNFTPDMQLRGQVQYDNISKDLSAILALPLGIRTGIGVAGRARRRRDA